MIPPVTVVIGVDGQLGSELITYLRAIGVERLVGLTHREVEITERDSIDKALRTASIWDACVGFVVNAAAYNLVDDCERNPDKAFAVNATGAENVARIAAEIGAGIIHFSTDYVFDGAKREPYVETGTPNPISVYGKSKLAGEEAVRRANRRHYILRTSGLYGHTPPRGRGANFVEMMLQRAAQGGAVEAVADQWLSPTYVRSIARQLPGILMAAPFGVYHVTNSGGCSWFEFAQEIFRQKGITVDLRPISAAQLGRPAKRPAYSVLENAALKELRLDVMPPWQVALAQYLSGRSVA